MHRGKQLWLVSLACAVCATAQAEWKGKGEAGIVFARGNSDADSVNLKIGMTQDLDQWKHTLDLAALRASTSGAVTAKRYQAGWQSDYKLSARAFWFGGLRYENDQFSGFSYQANATTGVGYKFIDTEKVKLAGQVGAGYRRLKNTLTGRASSEAIGTAGFMYENQLNASTKVVDNFRVESGSSNTLVGNFLGLEVKMSEKLALAVGLDVRSNSKPPASLKKTDMLTTANIVYSF
jgi:putative salt-induced outer membrane protein